MPGHGDAVGEDDDAGAGDVNVAHPSANRAPVGVDPPSAAKTVAASFPGVNVGDARRRYADVVVEACRQRTLVEATLLNKMYRFQKVMSQTSDQATFAKSMFSSQPFVILCNNRVVFGFLLFVSLALNFHAWSTLYMMVNLGLPSFSHYKFIALERRDGGFLGSNSTGGPGVLRFGLSDGLKTVESCDGGQTTSITADGSMLLSFNYAGAKRAARWSGWYIITSTEEGSQDRDPVRFRLEGSDDLENWKVVGASAFSNFGSTILYDDTVKYDMTMDRGAKVSWIMLPAAASYMTYFGVWFAYCVLVTGSWILPVINKSKWITVHIASAVVLMGATCIVGSILFVIMSHYPEYGGTANRTNAAYWATTGCIYSFFGINVILFPRFPEILLMGASLSSMLLQVNYNSNGLTWQSMASTGPLILIGFTAFLVRVRLIRIARSMSKDDKYMFEKVWQKLVGEQKKDLLLLEILVGKVHKASMRASGGGQVMQVNLRQKKYKSTSSFWSSWLPNFFPRSIKQSQNDDGAAAAAFAARRNTRRTSETAFGWDMPVISTDLEEAGKIPPPHNYMAPGIAGVDWSHNRLLHMISTFDTQFEADVSSPISSLDQLYCQATLVRASLFPMVLHLAARHNGLFPLKGEDVRFAPVEPRQWHDKNYLNKFQFGGLKGVQQCMDKVDNIYGGDVSRLLDICREKIVFERVSDLLACLKQLHEDPAVTIMRIKSSMTQSGQNFKIEGLRQISLNIKIQNDQTKRLCVNHHVCEASGIEKMIPCHADDRVVCPIATQMLLMTKGMASMMGNELALRFRFIRNINGLFEDSRPLRALLRPYNAVDGAVRNVLRKRSMSENSIHASNVVVPETTTTVVSGGALENQAMTSDGLGDVGLEREGIESVDATETSTDIAAAAVDGSQIRDGLTESPVGEAFGNSLNADVVSPLLTSSTSSITSAIASQWIIMGHPQFDDSQSWKTSWGVDIDCATMRVLETICRTSALGYSSILTESLGTAHWLGVDRAFNSSILFTSNPLTVGSMKAMWQVSAMLVGISQLLPFVIGPWADGVRFIGTEYRGQSFQHFRYTNVLAVNNSAANFSGVDAFMPIINDATGCQASLSWKESWASDGKYQMHEPRVQEVGNQIYVSYSTPVRYQGYTLSLGTDSEKIDTSSFLVRASKSAPEDPLALAESDWTIVGMPTWSGEWGSLESRFSFSKVNGNARVSFRQFSSPGTDKILYFYSGTQYLFRPVMLVLMGAGCILWAFFGFLKLANWAWGSLTLSVFMTAIAQIGYAFERAYYRQNMALGVTEVLLALLPVAGCCFQKYLLRVIFAFVLVATIDSILDLTGPHSLPGSNIDVGIHLKSVFEIMAFITATLIARTVAVNRSKHLVANDRKKYDALWHGEMESEDGLSSIIHLASVVRMLGLDVTDDKTYNTPIHQVNRCCLHWEPVPKAHRTKIAPQVTKERVKGDDHLFRSLNALYAQRTLEKDDHIQCLGQIYMQAIIANALMVKKVQQWALKTNGYFRLHDVHVQSQQQGRRVSRLGLGLEESYNGGNRRVSRLGLGLEGSLPGGSDLTSTLIGDANTPLVSRRFMKWADAKDDPAKVDAIKWPPLKRHRRIVEKLTRVYNNDVSRLVDISRHTIFFETFTDLTMCLGEIVTDFDVKVERIKSRMSVKYDSGQTAGYRDVALNVKIDSAMAAMLGCETHLCEVQLLLCKFGELKTQEGHARYVQFRDARAE